MTGQDDASGETKARRQLGIGRVLIAVYAILALAALGRSIFQIGTKFDTAPVSYSLSALAAVVYVLATIALLVNHDAWRIIAWVTITFELAGVIVVGTLSLIDPALFPHDSVWSVYGRGYLFIPLVLPVLGMIWLRKTGKSVE